MITSLFPPLTERQRYRLHMRREGPSIQLWGVAEGQPEGMNGGFLTAGQRYNDFEVIVVLQWMYQRSRGYL